MTTAGLRLLTAVCLCLSAGVIGNVLLLQGDGVGHIRNDRARAPAADRIGMPTKSAKATSLARGDGREAARPAPVAQPPRQLVQVIQRELAERSYFPGRPDGRLGVLTRAAILAFEQDHGLALTADASETVLSSILLGAVPAAGATGSGVGPEAKQLIKLVQGLLIGAGFKAIERTGRLDAATEQAIRTFEQRNGLAARGRISANLVTMLRRSGRAT